MNIIISPAERLLKAYRDRAKQYRNQYFVEYGKHLPIIQEVYSKAYFWHGTGRYHYDHATHSRYERTNSAKYLDVLQSIIKRGGLVPHFDPWIKISGNYKHTVSLTRCRMHARFYADTHRYENQPVTFEFGSTRYWLFLFMALVSFAILRYPTKSAREFVRMLFSRPSVQKGEQWLQAVRKNYKIKIWKFWQAFESRSDIIINYPILLGVKKADIKTLPISPFMDTFETRTDQPILFADLTHMEVPMEKVGEMKKLLQDNGIRLLVIPIEFGEIYCSQFTALELIYNPR